MLYNKDQCPVCGRKPATGSCTYEHHQVLRHFCSPRCRDNFIAHPLLYSNVRGNIPPQVMKRRSLRLAHSLDPVRAEALSSNLLHEVGIKQIDIRGDRLKVRYDLLLLTMQQLEQILEESDIAANNGWWQRLRRGWIYNSEANELDNLAMPEAACCSRPPPGAGVS